MSPDIAFALIVYSESTKEAEPNSSPVYVVVTPLKTKVYVCLNQSKFGPSS